MRHRYFLLRAMLALAVMRISCTAPESFELGTSALRDRPFHLDYV